MTALIGPVLMAVDRYCISTLPERRQLIKNTVKPPNKQPAMAEHTAYTEQFPWSQHVPLTYTWAENARF